MGSTVLNRHPVVEKAGLDDVLGDLPPGSAVVTDRWCHDRVAASGGDWTIVTATSVEAIALDGLVNQLGGAGRHGTAARRPVVLGIGTGVAVDAAKYVADAIGRPLVLAPSSTSTLAPFVTEIAIRRRRELHLQPATPATRLVIDTELLDQTPVSINRLGAAELIAALNATEDWRDQPDSSRPFSPAIAERVDDLVSRLDGISATVGSTTDDEATRAVHALASLMAEAGSLIDHVGHRRAFEGSEHLVVEATEHRLGSDAPDHGRIVALATVMMTELRDGDTERCRDLLTRCGVRAHPADLGIEEDVFNGLLRHTVRYAIGEQRVGTVLDHRPIDRPVAARLWREAWRLCR